MATPALRRILAGAGVSALAAAGLSIAAASLSIAAPAASAHTGGRPQLYIAGVKVQPTPARWDVQVMLTDADSGRPEPGFAVSVSGSGPSGVSFGPAALADPTNRGRYSAAVRATAGRWTLLVTAHDVPGGPAAVAVSRRYEVTLTPGQASDPAGSVTPAAAARRSWPSLLPLLAGGGLIGACAVAAVRLARALPGVPRSG
jgi:hypothetical protein